MVKLKPLLAVIDNHDRVYSRSGKSYADTYSERHNPETGDWEIYVSQQTYLPDLINVGVEESMPVNIMKRYELGETGILDQIIGSYVDLTKMPQSYVEAQNQLLQVQDRFNSLDPELRDMFDNNVNKYMYGLEDGSTVKLVSKYNDLLRKRKDDIIAKHAVSVSSAPPKEE